MDLCNINEIRDLLERHGFHFSKAKGQNFLIKDWVPKEIVLQSGITKDSGVLEIGPGIGPLTKELCASAGKVLAVEIDESLRPILKETLAGAENLEILFGDILKQNIPALVQEKFPGLKPAACANLPYYITTPILTALLESDAFSSVTVMVQKEVAKRICADPGSSDYGAFSIFCQYYAKTDFLFEVPASCFIPQPKVTSAVVKLTLRPHPDCKPKNPEFFFRTVHASFSVRRKTLLNGLKIGFPVLSKEELSDLLLSLGMEPNVRGETLGLPEFARLSDKLEEKLQEKS